MKTYAYKSHYEREGTNWTSLLACVGGTLLLMFAAMLFGFAYTGFNNVSTPVFTPNITLFKIIHLSVFALYGYSLHRIIITPALNRTSVRYKKVSASMWLAGLILAASWLLLFFTFELYLLSFIWSTLFASIIVTMLILSWRTDKLAAFSLAPCAMWMMFTVYLNLFVALMN